MVKTGDQCESTPEPDRLSPEEVAKAAAACDDSKGPDNTDCCKPPDAAPKESPRGKG